MIAAQEWIVAAWEGLKAVVASVGSEVLVAAVLVAVVGGLCAFRVWRLRGQTTPEQRAQWAREERARRRRATMRRAADRPYHVRRQSMREADRVDAAWRDSLPAVVDSTPADSGPCSDGGSGGGGDCS